MSELELLNKIKKQLLSKGQMYVSASKIDQMNTLKISSDDWHRIFKTDEYNEAKK